LVQRGRVLVATLAAVVAASTFVSAPATAAAPAQEQPQAPVGAARAGSSERAAAAVDGGLPLSAGPTVVTQPTVQVDMCGGVLAFGQIAACSSITGTEQHVYTVTSTVASDILATQFTRGSEFTSFSVGVTGPDGAGACSIFPMTGTCQLGAAGTYTVTVSLSFGGTDSYTLAVESMRTPSACTTLPDSFFSWATPALTASLAAGAAAHCYQFSQPVGAVLQLADPSSLFEDVRGEIRDAQFQPLCPVDGNRPCTLSQPGPYQLFVTEFFGRESTYKLRMPRLSNSFGCPKLKLARFGDPAPDAIGTGATTNSIDATCHKLKSVGPGPVVVRLNPATTELGWNLYDDAAQLVCSKFGALSCDLPTDGDYTIVMSNNETAGVRISYQIAVTALYRWAGCAFPTGTSWNVPTLTVRPDTAVSTHCQPFFGRAGDRIVHYGAVIVFNDLRRWLVDQNGVTVCPTPTSGQDGCVLPATGIYRLVSYLNRWDPNADPTYKLQVRRLSDPRGCAPVVGPGAYGAAPAGPLGVNRCRILDIPAGTYRIKAVDAANVTVSGQLYDATGLRKSCSSICDFPTPGRYTFIVSGGLVEEVRFAYVLLPAAPTVASGCLTVSATGYAEPAHRGEFTAAGQINCLEIVTDPRPALVQLLPGEPTGAARPVVNVVNIGGISVCDATALRRRACVLGPTTPYIVVLVAPEGIPTGQYAMAFARVNGPPACETLPAGADGVTVTTNADRFAACYSIPADGHAAQEVFAYQRTSGTGNAIISVFNAAGTRICGPTAPAADHTVTCNLPAGVPVTVIVEADSADATYRLTRNAPG
jgi:hypothetical protein